MRLLTSSSTTPCKEMLMNMAWSLEIVIHLSVSLEIKYSKESSYWLNRLWSILCTRWHEEHSCFAWFGCSLSRLFDLENCSFVELRLSWLEPESAAKREPPPNPLFIKLRFLSIEPGELCWLLYVQLLVLFGLMLLCVLYPPITPPKSERLLRLKELGVDELLLWGELLFRVSREVKRQHLINGTLKLYSSSTRSLLVIKCW